MGETKPRQLSCVLSIVYSDFEADFREVDTDQWFSYSRFGRRRRRTEIDSLDLCYQYNEREIGETITNPGMWAGAVASGFQKHARVGVPGGPRRRTTCQTGSASFRSHLTIRAGVLKLGQLWKRQLWKPKWSLGPQRRSPSVTSKSSGSNRKESSREDKRPAVF